MKGFRAFTQEGFGARACEFGGCHCRYCGFAIINGRIKEHVSEDEAIRQSSRNRGLA